VVGGGKEINSSCMSGGGLLPRQEDEPEKRARLEGGWVGDSLSEEGESLRSEKLAIGKRATKINEKKAINMNK